jgi:Carbohydrate binding module (family 6)/F5/8 type C domain/Glycosyl hydrolases family 16
MVVDAHGAGGMPARSRRWTRLGVAGLAALTVAGAWVATAVHAKAAVPPTPSGWNLMFSDDFTGPAGSGPGANWQYDVGTSYPGGPGPGFGTSEVETMTSNPANVSLDGNGNLKITALRDAAGNWTSGRIETPRGDFQPPAGGKLRVEARLQMPNVTAAAAAGYWPAFWMLGTPYRGNLWNWPSVGEIDIMENVNGINNEWGTFHCGTSPGGYCNEKSGIGGQRACSPTTCQAAFHTYTVEWDTSTSPQTLKWYLDGVNFHTVTSAQMDAATWAAATNHGFFIILNLAMGGEFPAALGGGPTSATASGKSMLVDYVAVWSGGAGAGGPSSPPTPPVSPPPTCGPLISQNMPTSSSSNEAANLGPQYAVDGNPATRWSSGFSDPQWMQIDLGSAKPITRVRLNWEAAYASAYQIQTSTNGSTWTTAYDVSAGDGGIDDLAVSATARYVRMYGIARATPYGYSLWEFEVYGDCGTPTASPPASGTPSPSRSPTSGPTGAPGNRDGYGPIQAESFNQQSGLTAETTTDTGGGQDMTNASNGDYALFQGVNFGSTPATQFYGRVASGAAGGVSGLVEVRLDSLSSAPVGSFAVANTGGWQSWRTVPANITGVTGTHNVYLTFTSGQPAAFVSVNWFDFGH